MAERSYRLDPKQISDDDPVPLKVAAVIFYPAGGVTERWLYRQIRDGKLVAEWLGQKCFLTRRYLADFEMRFPVAGEVYFVLCCGFVKIGYSEKLDRRIYGFSEVLPQPPRLLLSMPGRIGDERGFHRRFAKLRTHREWFALDGELLAYLREQGCNV